MECSLETRIEEHCLFILLGQANKLVVAEPRTTLPAPEHPNAYIILLHRPWGSTPITETGKMI
jgi:hypothetical protein